MRGHLWNPISSSLTSSCFAGLNPWQGDFVMIWITMTQQIKSAKSLFVCKAQFSLFPIAKEVQDWNIWSCWWLSAKASTSATELKQQQPNLSIVFSLLKNFSSPVRKQKEIFPRCFISGIACSAASNSRYFPSTILPLPKGNECSDQGVHQG